MRRLALGLASVAALLAPAGAARAAERVSIKPASKAFAFLADYYRLPAGQRSRFALAYAVQDNERPVPSQLTLLDGAAETPLPASPDGWLTRLPPPEALARGAQLRAVIPAEGKPGFSMIPEAILRDQADIQVSDLREAADQVGAVTRRLGPLALVLPKFTRVLFSGAEGAVAVDGQGRTRPLASWRGTPYLDLKTPGDVRAVRFAKPPYHALLSPVMK